MVLPLDSLRSCRTYPYDSGRAYSSAPSSSGSLWAVDVAGACMECAEDAAVDGSSLSTPRK